jgi:Zn finger protein HypA/HybF involved in hydrogenase expression
MSWKEFEEFYVDIPDEAIPKYCPNCASKLVRISDGKVWVAPMGQPYQVIHLEITTFDVYCDKCEWSGDISPDLPERIIIKQKETEE